MMEEHEFILKATVKVLSLDDKLLQFSTLVMFRIHDMEEFIKDESISHEQILSIGYKATGRLYAPSISGPFPLSCCYSDPDIFKRVVPNIIDGQYLFHSDNNKKVSELITDYFYSCFNCKHKADPPKSVVVIEVLRKFVYIGDTGGEPAVKSQAEELGTSSLDIVHGEEYYSETELRDILGSVYGLMISCGFQLSTNAPTETGRLSQVKSAIKMWIFNGKSAEVEENECPICLGGIHDGQLIAKMPCSHTFHKDCVFKWLLKRADSCPLCRSMCKTIII